MTIKGRMQRFSEWKNDKVLDAENRAVIQLEQKIMAEDGIDYAELMHRIETDPHYSLVIKMQRLSIDSVMMPTKGKKLKQEFLDSLTPEEMKVYETEVGSSAEIVGKEIKAKLKRKLV